MNEQQALVKREEFGAEQIATTSEKSVAGIAAREQAIIQAEYVMAERHPRVWLDVRGRMMDHCRRPRFAEVTRYCKPVGKALINDVWTETKARGFTIRFAETLAQEMGNVKPWTSTSYEDDQLRIVRIGVTDLQRNVPWSQEVTVAKVVEKRGKKRGEEWLPPEGRDVISSRVNSRGDMTFLVAATDDEILAKQNSAISKVQRNFLLKLCPRDILEDCEEKVAETLAKEDKSDPKAAVKKWIDRFGGLGVIPSDLINYLGKPVEQWRDEDVTTLRELGTAIKEGETTFQQALKIRYTAAEPPEGEKGPTQQGTAERKIADMKAQEGSLLGIELAKGFNALETILGSSAFGRMLGAAGYATLTEIPDFKTGRKVYKAMVTEAQAAGFTMGAVDA
ncbi:MAG: hypothetical protein V1790_17425 [Planctomycetota bacterium]